MALRSCNNFVKTATRTLHLTTRLNVSHRTCIRSFYSTTVAGAIPVLSVHPTRGLVDEKFQLVVKNLTPGLKVTLHSLHLSEDKDYWEAFGHYVSDDSGTVTVSKDASVGGLYEGVEPMGLLWSMVPVPGSRTGIRLRKVDVLSPQVILISVHSGHLSEGLMNQVPLTSVSIERWYIAPGVRRIEIQEKGVKGTLFIPPGPGPFPGVMDLWGGGGGLVEYRSSLLASHGFASLALDYFSPDSKESLDQRSFEMAFTKMQEHPLVLEDRIAIFGLSFGATVSTALIANSNIINAHCGVFISGSHTVPVHKPFYGLIEEMYKNLHKSRLNEEGYLIWKDLFLPIPSDPDLKVDMGKVKCPLMLVYGEDDQSWATIESAEDISRMMHEAGNEHLLTRHSYPGAGHLIEPPYTPLCRASNFLVPITQERVIMFWGGRPKPHADAQEDSWGKILAFLQQHLYSGFEVAHSAKIPEK